MTWLLDTNACIRYLNGRSPKLRASFDAADPGGILVCSVVKAELYFGAALSHDPGKTLASQRLFFDSCPSMISRSLPMPRFELTLRAREK